jgi:hypothetical protein
MPGRSLKRVQHPGSGEPKWREPAGDFGPRRSITPWKVAGNNLKNGKSSPRRSQENGEKKAEPRGEVLKVGIEASGVADHPWKMAKGSPANSAHPLKDG